jgi:hypothetical protein
MRILRARPSRVSRDHASRFARHSSDGPPLGGKDAEFCREKCSPHPRGRAPDRTRRRLAWSRVPSTPRASRRIARACTPATVWARPSACKACVRPRTPAVAGNQAGATQAPRDRKGRRSKARRRRARATGHQEFRRGPTTPRAESVEEIFEAHGTEGCRRCYDDVARRGRRRVRRRRPSRWRGRRRKDRRSGRRCDADHDPRRTISRFSATEATRQRKTDRAETRR